MREFIIYTKEQCTTCCFHVSIRLKATYVAKSNILVLGVYFIPLSEACHPPPQSTRGQYKLACSVRRGGNYLPHPPPIPEQRSFECTQGSSKAMLHTWALPSPQREALATRVIFSNRKKDGDLQLFLQGKSWKLVIALPCWGKNIQASKVTSFGWMPTQSWALSSLRYLVLNSSCWLLSWYFSYAYLLPHLFELLTNELIYLILWICSWNIITYWNSDINKLLSLIKHIQ